MGNAGRRRALALTGAIALGFLATGCEPPAPAWQVELISVNADGTNGGDSYSGGTWNSPDYAVSPDGTKVAFSSLATDIADGVDTPAVYLRDLTTATTTQILPKQARDLEFSPDGTKLLMTNIDGNTALGGVTEVSLWVHDLATGTNSVLSPDVGIDRTVGEGVLPPILPYSTWSPDGTKVAFTTWKSLVPQDTNQCTYRKPTGIPYNYIVYGAGCYDLYIHDLAAGTDTLVSVRADGTAAGAGQTTLARTDGVFSPDGQRITFVSEAANLTPAAAPSGVYVRDLVSGTTTLVPGTNNLNATSSTNVLRDSVFTPDGSAIVFVLDQVYLYDFAGPSLALVTARPGTNYASNGITDTFDVSPDGSKIAFDSNAADILPNDPRPFQYTDVYVRDLASGTTELVSISPDETDSGNNHSSSPVFSPDGTKIAFTSAADNLGPTDEDGSGYDVYVRDLTKGNTHLVSTAAPDTDPGTSGHARDPLFDSQGAVVFAASGTSLGSVQPPSLRNVYRAELHGADLTAGLGGQAAGGSATLQVDATNAGPDEAPDTSVFLVLPAGATFVQATGDVEGCTPDPTRPTFVLCQLGDLPSNSTRSFEVTASLPSTPGPSLPVWAAVQSHTLDPDIRDNTTHIALTPP